VTERERVGEVYQGYAASAAKQRDWSAENPGNIAIRAELAGAVFGLAGARLRRAERILDVGCGSGWWLARLAADPHVSASLEGVELLAERQAAATQRVPEAAIRLGDARRLPYGNRHFDAVTMFTVLSSLSSVADALVAFGEALRVVRPPGVLVVWEPRLPNPLNRHTLWITGGMLREAAGANPITVRTTTVLPFVARRLGRRTERLYPRLAEVAPLRSHRLVCVNVG
jgi:ubiquinone/menaquinone biosynthesis C-methylase UbiE